MRLKAGIHTHYIRRPDVPDVVAVDAECFSDPWTEEEFIDAARDRRAQIICLRYNTAIVGFIVLRAEPGVCEILRLAVKPKFRRRAFGRELIKVARRRLNDRRPLLQVEVVETEISVLNFFRACDFRAEKVIWREHGPDDILMQYRYSPEVD